MTNQKKTGARGLPRKVAQKRWDDMLVAARELTAIHTYNFKAYDRELSSLLVKYLGPDIPTTENWNACTLAGLAFLAYLDDLEGTSGYMSIKDRVLLRKLSDDTRVAH